MDRIQKCVIDIIKCALAGKTLPNEISSVAATERKAVIAYAERQGLLPFLQYYDDFEESDSDLFFKRLAFYTYRDVEQMEELQELLSTFEKNGIYCIPLKGVRTKQFYPSSELRTMGDIDILYRKDQNLQLKETMREQGYVSGGDAAKHDHYQKNGSVIEMHKALLPAESVASFYFEGIWDRATVQEGKKYVYQMSLEDHYLYTLCHLLEHFIRGGIGIRMVLDMYILSQLPEMDWKYVNEKLQDLKIDAFEKNIRALSEQWFSNKADVKCDFRELEDYILNGGIFGSRENSDQNTAILYISGYQYLLRTIFPSYRVMRTVYPWLHTPWLLPMAWVQRWGNVWINRKGNVRIHFRLASAIRGQNKDNLIRRKNFFIKWGFNPSGKKR